MKKIWLCLVLCVFIIGATGCSKDPERTGKMGPELSCSRIDVHLDLKKGETAELVSCDENSMLFSIARGAKYWRHTEQYVLYNIKEGKIEKHFPMEKERSSWDAISDGRGIYYCTYKVGDPPQGEWRLEYMSEGKRQIIDSGYGNVNNPMFMFYLDDSLYYTYADETDGREWGVRHIEHGKPAAVLSEKSSGLEFAGSSDDEYYLLTGGGELLICDGTGVRSRHEIDTEDAYAIDSFGEDRLLCLLGEEDDAKLTVINMKTGKEAASDVTLRTFPVAAFGQNLLCADDDNRQYYIQADDVGHVKRLELPNQMDCKLSGARRMGSGAGWAIVRTDDGEFYLLEQR